MTAQQNTLSETEKTGKSDKISSSFVTKSNKNVFTKNIHTLSYQFYSIQNKYIDDQLSQPKSNLEHMLIILQSLKAIYETTILKCANLFPNSFHCTHEHYVIISIIVQSHIMNVHCF